MKRFLIGLLSGILILAACTPATMESTVIHPSTATPTIVPATFTPSPTQIPPTRAIITVTPAPRAECQDNLTVSKPDFSFLEPRPFLDMSERDQVIDEIRQRIVIFLNQYGMEPLLDYINKTSIQRGVDIHNVYILRDITNDTRPELMFIGAIFGCYQKEYKILIEFDPYVTGGIPSFEQIHDGNRNGLPEIIVNTLTGNHGGRWYEIYEWAGQGFQRVMDEFFTNSDGSWEYQDLNADGIQELIVTEGTVVWPPSLIIPLRDKYTYYQWDGTNYIKYNSEFDRPIYRFQAIQDADQYARTNKFDKALSLYKAAIFDDKLDWWSRNKGVYQAEYQTAIFARFVEGTLQPTRIPPTEPAKDATEYPRLAAYAHYRIMLINLVQGNESDAEATHGALQQKFGNDPYGHPYVEMATSFWDAYQSTHKMYDGCAAAIGYAAKHPEILIPLGSDYHDSQSHTYVPADVCPFR